ncbi:tetratricopeptide repeat protein [Nonomuraea sp. NN258]|uniref:tetratricopeptide repeat protein n=1 Tax=Nonomuraea antri TaxID=2730852 RepID=UPI0015696CBA|nr:tetratricopeptide repeat protein [Nonomuraea antri]NRQ38943.1 tetratricopeptide repeat protein [Nonomuraea antri]
MSPLRAKAGLLMGLGALVAVTSCGVFATVLSSGEDTGRSQYLAGVALLEEGRPRQAAALLRPLISASPANPDLLLALGTAEITTNPPRGRRVLRRFLEVAPPEHPAVPRVRELVER